MFMHCIQDIESLFKVEVRKTFCSGGFGFNIQQKVPAEVHLPTVLSHQLPRDTAHIIDHIWDALQRAVQKTSPPPRTLTELRRALQDAWCQFPPEQLQTLVESRPRVFAALLRLRGATHDIRQLYQFL